MTVKLNLRVSLAAKPIITLPPDRIVAYVLHDQETGYYNYKPRSLVDPNDKLDNDVGYPETVPLVFRDFVNLTEAWQWFWFPSCRPTAF